MKSTAWIFLIVLLAIMPACGYRFSAGGSLPGNVSTVAVTVFENNSAYSGAEVRFANALIREIMMSAGTQVVPLENAQAVISGTVRTVTFSRLARTSSDQVLDRQVTAVVDLEMRDAKGKMIWQIHRFKAVEEGVVSSENASDETSKRTVIDQAFGRMAHKIVAKMQDRF